MNSTSPHFFRLGRLWLGSLVVLVGGLSARAADAPRAAPQTVDLSYHEAPSGMISLSLNITPVSVPFAKEPVVSAQVHRGKFRLGGADTNSIAFLWDRKSGKLYLDLNRNLDLTDDAKGVFTPQSGYGGNYASFTNIHLTLRGSAGEQPLAGDLTLYGYGSQPNGWFALRSLWHGKASLLGSEMEVGLISSDLARLDPGQASLLLLRPWARRDKPFGTQDGSLQAVRFGRKLFWNGHAYALTLTNAPGGKTGSPQLRFAEEQTTLGEARISGKFIERLVLDGPYLVVLDRPAAAVRVPVGSYSEPQVCLQAGDTAAYLETDRSPTQRKLTVSEQTPAELNIGGPLTNSVVVTRHGSSLQLSYQLVGLGQRAYTRVNLDRTKPPEWTAYRGDTKVGSGKFEFG